MTIPAWGRNAYGIWNSRESGTPWTQLTYNWHGAPVEIQVWGEWRQGTITQIDDLHNRLTCEIWLPNGKLVEITASRQAYRKITTKEDSNA